MSKLGEVIEQAMKTHNPPITYKKFDDVKSKVSASYVNRLVRTNRHNPSLDKLDAIAEVLDIDTSVLIEARNQDLKAPSRGGKKYSMFSAPVSLTEARSKIISELIVQLTTIDTFDAKSISTLLPTIEKFIETNNDSTEETVEQSIQRAFISDYVRGYIDVDWFESFGLNKTLVTRLMEEPESVKLTEKDIAKFGTAWRAYTE